MHLAESAEESELLEHGTGPFRDLLSEIGAIGPRWRHPGATPASVLDAAGLLTPRTLAVHGVHLTRMDAALLAARGSSLALCPRSNARLGVGAAPVTMLLAEGVRLALGTDALASNEDLDVFAELAALRTLAPEAPPEALLRAATLGGAEALGWSDAFGSIEPGKTGSLVALVWRGPAAARNTLADGIVRVGPRDDSVAYDPGRPAHRPASDNEPYARVFAGPSLVKVTALQ